MGLAWKPRVPGPDGSGLKARLEEQLLPRAPALPVPEARAADAIDGVDPAEEPVELLPQESEASQSMYHQLVR